MSRNKHSTTFKFKLALAGMKDDKSVAQLCQEYDLAASQIYTWKKELEERGMGAHRYGISFATYKRDL